MDLNLLHPDTDSDANYLEKKRYLVVYLYYQYTSRTLLQNSSCYKVSSYIFFSLRNPIPQNHLSLSSFLLRWVFCWLVFSVFLYIAVLFDFSNFVFFFDSNMTFFTWPANYFFNLTRGSFGLSSSRIKMQLWRQMLLSSEFLIVTSPKRSTKPGDFTWKEHLFSRSLH